MTATLKTASPLPYDNISTPVDTIDTQTEVTTPARRGFFSTKLRIGLAIAAVCGAVCVTLGAVFVFHTKVRNHAVDIITQIQQAPGLKVTLTAKRASMAFNGQTSAVVYVVPRPTSTPTLLFDAYLSQVGPEITQNYLLLQDRAYWSVTSSGETMTVLSAGCLDTSALPPIHLMQTSLHDSSVVDSVNGDNITFEDCPDGKLLRLAFAGEVFVFCNSKNNKLTHAAGQDLDIAVEYLTDGTQLPEMEIPVVPGKKDALECPRLVHDAVPAPTSLTTSLMQTSKEVMSVMAGNERSWWFGSSKCGCKMGKKKPCLFVHGVGETEAKPMTNTFPEGWGDIHEHAPCCSSVKFVHLETTKQRWDNDALQKDFCKEALIVGRDPKAYNPVKDLNNMILVTFSMGNLIAGSAVANGHCNIGRDVTWVSIAGPMQGSKTANMLETKCTGGGWGNAILKFLAKQVGFCPIEPAYYSLKHQTTVSESTRMKFLAAQAARRKFATRFLCGTSASGLNTLASQAVNLVAAMSGHDNPNNDGVVDFTSCSAGVDGSRFGDDADSAYHYKADINHLDASFRNGDGWYGRSRKPLKWFECAL